MDLTVAPYYVYALVDPTNGLAFYIGKGKKARCFQHAVLARRGRHYNLAVQLRIRRIQQAGVEPIALRLFESLDESAALQLERLLIARVGRDRLLNNDDGQASKHETYLEGCRAVAAVARSFPVATRPPVVASILAQVEHILALPRAEQAFFVYDTVIVHADGTCEFR